MTTRIFRFRQFEISSEAGASGQSGVTADELAVPEFEAVCVSGEEADCGEGSGTVPDADALVRWMVEHTRDTDHRRFRRTYGEYAIVEPGAWV